MRRARRRERPPIVAVVLAGIAVLFFALPLLGLLWRVPWSRTWDVLSSRSVGRALQLSITTSLIAALVSMVFGVPLAWMLARVGFPGRSVVRALSTLSMVLPAVVGGVALFFSFGRRGLFGQYLDEWFGIRLPFTSAGVVVAQVFVAMPFLVLSVESSIRQLDVRLEEAARTLGGSRWYVFWRITLPAIRPGVVAGAVLAWSRALGEFGATITFAGNLPGRTQTMPLATYLALESDPEAALVLSVVLIAVSFAVLLGLRDRWLGQARPAGAAPQGPAAVTT